MNEPQVSTVASAVTGQDSLSVCLQSRFEDWLESRKPQEEKFLKQYADAMRIPRDDDTKDTGASKAQKAKLFIGSTRGKIRTARAKIKDALFSSGKMPFDTTPSNEKLKGYADTLEEILTWQLEQMEFKQMMGGGVNALCTYGTSTIFGPFTKQKTHTSVDQQPDEYGQMALVETEHSYACPYYEHAPTMDVYADPEANDTQKGLGVYWSSWKQPHEVSSWKKMDGYKAEAIDYALTQLSTQSSSEGSDLTTDERANLYRFAKDGRIRILRFFGLVKRADLSAWAGSDEVNMAAPESDGEMVEAVIIMAGGVVIKADESPYKKKRPSYRCVYEEVEHEFYGVGIAENNEPHQAVVNAAFRLYMEGKAFALLKTCSIDRSKFTAKEDFKLFPGKNYDMRPGLTPDERKTAIIWHDVQDVTQGWENVIELSEKFSDDDTGISKYSQGNDASHLNKTATGVSMIMGASSLPLKEVIQNVDQMWIECMVEGLIEWSLEHLEPETVAALLGEKQAKIWAEIKQFGKTSFMTWQATGSSTFMAKEVLMQKLQGFMQLALGNPLTAPLVDARELLEQVWNSGEIGKESPVLSDEDMKTKQGPQIPPEVEQALQKQDELITQLEQQLKEAQAGQQLKMAELQQNGQIKMMELALKRQDSDVKAATAEQDSHLTTAQIEKTQAETVLTLRNAELAENQDKIEDEVTEAVSDEPQS